MSTKGAKYAGLCLGTTPTPPQGGRAYNVFTSPSPFGEGRGGASRLLQSFCILTIALLSQACNTTKKLTNGQYLFVSAKIEGNKKVDDEALTNLLQQKPNRQILGSTPYLYFYQLGQKLYDKKKVQAKIDRIKKKYDAKIAKAGDPKSAKAQRLRTIRDGKLDKQNVVLDQGNWLMRTVGEPPSIYDPNATVQSGRQMRNLLFNKGFFSGTVSAKVDTLKRHRIRVVYHVVEGLPQKIRSVRYRAYNKQIQHLLDSLSAQKPLVEAGDRYDQDKLGAERERIDKAVRNSGFYAFSRDYIFIEADTGIQDSALGTRAIDIVYTVKDPTSGDHQKYRVAEIDFHIANTGGFARTDTTIQQFNGISYYTPYRRLPFRLLDSKILVRPGSYYNADALNNSQAQLQTMDMFRFVNFSFDTLKAGSTDFRLRIATSRLPKYQVSDEVGLLVSQGAPGPFVNLGFKVRNGLNMFEIFEVSGRYSQEGQFSPFSGEQVYRAREFGVNGTLTFPGIVIPGRVSYLFNNRNPKTRLQVGYTDLRRPEYSQKIFKGTVGYSINLSKNSIVGINVIDASFVRTTRILTTFLKYLDQQKQRGNSQIYAFANQVVTSLSGFYVYNTTSQTEKKRGVYVRVFGEIGGELPNLIAKDYQPSFGTGRTTYNTDATTGDTTNGHLPVDTAGRFIKVNKDVLQVFRFTKIQADFRYYYPTGKNTLWVVRVNGGVAIPRGGISTLPYIKYFFSGGSNSVRAWAPRRLGPGTYAAQTDQTYYAEQPGNVLIEANLELRQKLIGIFEGALFADAGNVWTLKKEDARPGAEFKANFIPTMALGTGAGLRLDFTFLVVRLDLGVKTYDPSYPEGKRWVIKDFSFKKKANGYQQVLLNLGIGYPF